MEYYLFDIKNKKIIRVNENEVIDKLYFLECRPIYLEELKMAKKNKPTEKNIVNFLNSDTPENLIKLMRENISKIENKVPLYDIYTENIYIIGKHNVYDRVIHQYYRFPEKELIDELLIKRDEVKNKISNQNITDKIILRKLNKLNLMIKFMNYFDIDILFGTYTKVFYKYSQFVGKDTTICKNPSFLQNFHHLRPYFTRSEVLNLALNLEIKMSKDMDEISQEEISKLCKQIKKNQISSDMLIIHNKYILDNEILGLAQYYTLQGSFFINQYLRNKTNHQFKNEFIENLITPMWKLVLNSPEFDKSYTIYRFVQEDSYLQHLKIGDVFTEKGFMSTTRDPFYRSDLYKFGFILIKINIPANKKGVALCIETISHFPEEQEIIFPPNTKFKLIRRDDDCLYYHTDPLFSSKIKTRYEFDWVGSSEINFERNKMISDNKVIIDFLKIHKPNTITLNEKIKYFESNFVNQLYQFQTLLGEKEFTILTEMYDSTGAYKKYYAIETKNGYSIYTIYKGYILFFIEIGETVEGRQMHVNYYVKYSSIDSSKVIGDDNLIRFFSSVAYYFDISTIILYANYLNCGTNVVEQNGGTKQRGFSESKKKYRNEKKQNDNNITTFGGSYCKDLYQYLSTGEKRYSDINILNVELQPKFSYHDLDMLKKISPSQILKKEDRDELYQIYDKSYKVIGKDTISDFYEWLKDNKCYLLDNYAIKIDRLLGNNNPFRNDMYILDPITYLYNRKYIKVYSTFPNINTVIKRNILKENKNDYRN